MQNSITLPQISPLLYFCCIDNFIKGHNTVMVSGGRKNSNVKRKKKYKMMKKCQTDFLFICKIEFLSERLLFFFFVLSIHGKTWQITALSDKNFLRSRFFFYNLKSFWRLNSHVLNENKDCWPHWFSFLVSVFLNKNYFQFCKCIFFIHWKIP